MVLCDPQLGSTLPTRPAGAPLSTCWGGEACFDSRRRVNSDVRAHRCVRTASGSDPIINSSWMFDPIATAQDSVTHTSPPLFCSRAEPVGRYNQGRSKNRGRLLDLIGLILSILLVLAPYQAPAQQISDT